jgi:hypothetical protein
MVVIKAERQRGIFPLPLKHFEKQAAAPSLGISRCNNRRRHCSNHVNAWVDDIATTLNSMYAGEEFVESFESPRKVANAAQSQCLQSILRSVLEMGKPPNDLSGQEALRELQAAECYAGTPASLAQFSGDLVSLPSPGSMPASLGTILKDEAVPICELLTSKLLPISDVRCKKEAFKIKKPPTMTQ